MTTPDNPIVRKLLKARLPLMVSKTTLPKEGRNDLRAIVQDKTYLVDGARKHFVFNPESTRSNARVVRHSAVFAKELVLAAEPMQFAPLADLLREVRLYTFMDDAAGLIDILSTVGKGYWVIPDFDNIDAIPNPFVWNDALAWLGKHATDGGGLILGVASPWPGQARLTDTFMQQLGDFQTVVA